MNNYTVVKDGKGWGVEWRGALVNQEPMSKQDAQELADACNAPDKQPADVLPELE